MSTSDGGEVSPEFLYIPGDFGDLVPVTRRAPTEHVSECGFSLSYVTC